LFCESVFSPLIENRLDEWMSRSHQGDHCSSFKWEARVFGSGTQ
jgi:hypothetical protein